MVSVFFGEQEIAAIRERLARHHWARQVLERLRLGLETEREALLAGRGPRGRSLGQAFLELALCSRLLPGWHGEAARTLLRVNDAPGKWLGKQTLDFCLAFDFLPALGEPLRGQVSERLLLPLAERLMQQRRGGSNHQTTYNLGLLSLGLLTGRRDCIARVTADPALGCPYHLAHGVHPDGFWYEQSHASYHLGTLERFLRTRWIADRHEIPLGGDEVIRRMLDTMPAMALPGGVLPLLGDVAGDDQPTLFRTSLLELAYAMYALPWIAWALRRTARDDLWSLLVGRELGPAEAPPPQSVLFPQTGLCVLKHGRRDGYWDGQGAGVSVTFGPHGDWHGHAGKLALEYRHHRHYLIRDHGHSGNYDHPIHRLWYMSTLAHSTVVLDERNQSFTWTHDRPERERAESGVCHAHFFNDAVSACTVSADFAYPGCRLRRTVFLTATYLLDLMECDSLDGAEHTFDWVLHTGGTLRSDLPFGPAALACHNKGAIPTPPNHPYSPGAQAPSSYDYIREVEALTTADRWSIAVMDCRWAADVWKITGQAMRLTMLGEPGTTVYKGVCPAAARDVYDPVILVRRRTRQTVFIALHVPGEQSLDVAGLTVAAGCIACRVSGPGTGSDLLVKRDTADPAVIAGRAVSGKLAYCPEST